MRAAEFEEKEYEGVLYSQLENNRLDVWCPGQVFERHMGIDRAAFVTSPTIWRILGRSIARGAVLNRYDWDYMWRRRPRRPMPNFRLNLFIQAKRPLRYQRTPRHIRGSLNAPGFCFSLEDHQQIALERVAARLRNRAAILYAAPAFHTVLELYAHTQSGTVVEQSTFPDVSRLSGHSKWFYDAPGATGVANPDAEFVEGPTLDETIAKLRNEQTMTSADNTAENLGMLSEIIVSTLRESAIGPNGRTAIYFERLRVAEREFSELEIARTQVRDFYRVALFAETFNVEWFTIS